MKSSRILMLLTAAALAASCSSSPGKPSAGAIASSSPAPTTAPTTASPPVNPYAGLTAAARDRQLLSAARSGNAGKISLLLDVGARIEARDDRERTPLLIASAHDRVEAARVLVAAGADPDALDDRHDTPWLVTGVTGSVEMAEIILAADPDLTIRNRFGGLSHIPASERGHAEYVAYVVDHTDIVVDHVNDLGWTALLEAVILGQGTKPWQRIVQSLVDHGADVSIADRNGVTPLRHARNRGFDEVGRILERAAA
jgi:uncharacterized protein